MNILKTRLITGLLLLISSSLWAQTKQNSNEVRLVKEIDISHYVGKKYQLTTNIKCNLADSSSQYGLFVLQVGRHEYDFIEASGKNDVSSVKAADWKTVSFEGIIQPRAKRIWIYLTALGNGDFFFDDLSLKIQDDKATWNTIPINNHDFEETADIKKTLKGFKNTKTVTANPNIRASIATTDKGNALLVSSRNNTVTYKTNYGQNHSAGNYLAMKDGRKIYYEVYGDGEPLLLLHGNGGSIRSFAGTIPELAKHYKVIAVDTRGQGKSVDKETINFNYELFAGDMETLISKLNLQQVNIVGWSDGAITGLLLAMRNPLLVKKLVLMGVNLNPTTEAVSPGIISQAKKDIEKLRKHNDPKDQTTTRLLEMILKEPNIPVSELSKVNAETLVMAGEKDLVLKKHTTLIAENIKNSQLHIVKGETHFLPEENPELFNKIVLDFLQHK